MRAQIFALSLLVAFASWSACKSPADASVAVASAQPDVLDRLAHGGRLYSAHCAVCHGDRGAGDGPASPFLFPAARDFTRASFRLVSTENGRPTHADLQRTLRRGIPGSAMPAWPWMEQADLEALADFVMHLATQGVARELVLAGRTDEEALAEASAFLTPGTVLPEVAQAVPTAALLAEGEALYQSHCAACHGADGTGRVEPRFDEDGSLNWPRDFTAGYLKGGRSAQALGWRIQAGLPGTAMPGTSLETEQLEALVAYVQAQVSPQAETNLVHRRDRIRAPRVDQLPPTPDDPAWGRGEEVEVVLAPLDAARSGAGVKRAWVTAAHDGDEVALRVRWKDDTGNSRVYSDLAGPDACALQFSLDASPRYFGMGSAARSSDIWHWKALRASEVAGALDLLDPPHAFVETYAGDVRTDVPLYRPSLTLPDVSPTVESLRAGGIGTLASMGSEGDVRAQPHWAPGEWTVVFTRSCRPPASARSGASGEFPMLPGARLHVAVAIWDGAAGDRAARKSISIWQELQLEP